MCRSCPLAEGEPIVKRRGVQMFRTRNLELRLAGWFETPQLVQNSNFLLHAVLLFAASSAQSADLQDSADERISTEQPDEENEISRCFIRP